MVRLWKPKRAVREDDLGGMVSVLISAVASLGLSSGSHIFLWTHVSLDGDLLGE
jgi:hypothetical protein